MKNLRYKAMGLMTYFFLFFSFSQLQAVTLDQLKQTLTKLKTRLSTLSKKIDLLGKPTEKNAEKKATHAELQKAFNIVNNANILDKQYDFESFSALKDLTTRQSINISADIGKNLAVLIANHENINTVTMIMGEFEVEGLNMIIESIVKNTKVKILNLAGSRTKETGQNVDLNIKPLDSLTSLTSLNLMEVPISKQVIKSIAKLTSLTDLDISWRNTLTNPILQLLATKLSALKSLNLTGCRINDEKLKLIVSTLNESLEKLILKENWIDNIPTSIIQKRLKSLKHLDLSANSLPPGEFPAKIGHLSQDEMKDTGVYTAN